MQQKLRASWTPERRRRQALSMKRNLKKVQAGRARARAQAKRLNGAARDGKQYSRAHGRYVRTPDVRARQALAARRMWQQRRAASNAPPAEAFAQALVALVGEAVRAELARMFAQPEI